MESKFHFEQLEIWQKSIDFAAYIIRLTEEIPFKRNHFRLIEQLEFAVISIAANIAEGATRTSPNEYLQCLSIAKGSLAELEYYLHLVKRLGYIDQSQELPLRQLHVQTAKTLHGLLVFVRQSREKESFSLVH